MIFWDKEEITSETIEITERKIPSTVITKCAKTIENNTMNTYSRL